MDTHGRWARWLGVALSGLMLVPGVEAAKPQPIVTGTPVMLKDLQGALSGNPGNLTRVGNKIVFAADDGASGSELWVTDGTPGGTQLLKDVRPGTASSSPSHFVSGDDYALFFADEDGTGTKLWRTDGTAPGTFKVVDLPLSIASVTPSPRLGNVVFFNVGFSGSAEGFEVWRSDGSIAGTYVLKDICLGSGGSNSAPLVAVPELGYMFFTPSDCGTGANVGKELWRTDGTSAGTVLVKDLFPGSSSGSPTCLAAINGHLWFQAKRTDAEGIELWTSDGTTAGTVFVKDIEPTAATSSSPCNFAAAGSTVVFSARTAAQGAELWRSDGTGAGTVLVKDINAGASDSSRAGSRVSAAVWYSLPPTLPQGASLGSPTAPPRARCAWPISTPA